jgi:hypothetical protein
MTAVRLRLTHRDHLALMTHLLPGDGLEAVAVALCGRRADSDVLIVHQVQLIPYDECGVRAADRVTWSTKRLVPLLEKAAKYDLGVLKIHSHPGGYRAFSSTDDTSDKDLFESIYGWTDSAFPHVSAVMLPSGEMFGRAILPNGEFEPLHSIMVPGDDIAIWSDMPEETVASTLRRHAQLFGRGTINKLRLMSAAVVGCSGTGSPVVEQFARLGFGRLVLVDPDVVEDRNLNRILNSSREDAYLGRPKVEVMARAIAAMGFGTELQINRADLATPRAVKAVAGCDVVFGCMDGVEGRHLLNRLAAYYGLPYFDIGVKLQADGNGGIEEVVGAVHYLRPDGATLMDRGVYDGEQLRAAGLKRTDPDAYREEVRRGYIHGVAEDRPAVISINMQMAATAVNEFLARIHPYRLDDNSDSAVVRVNFVSGETVRNTDGPQSGMFRRSMGRGDVSPLLGMPELSEAPR